MTPKWLSNDRQSPLNYWRTIPERPRIDPELKSTRIWGGLINHSPRLDRLSWIRLLVQLIQILRSRGDPGYYGQLKIEISKTKGNEKHSYCLLIAP